MASAQVLSKPVVTTKNKNKDLEAGRRKLEEFRRKKAVTKNSKLKSQPSTDDATTCEKQLLDNGHASTVDSVRALSNVSSNTVPGSFGLSSYDKPHVSPNFYGSGSVSYAQFDAQSDNLIESDFHQKLPRQEGNSYETGSNFSPTTDRSVGNGNSSSDTGENRYANLISSSSPISFQDSSSNDSHSIFKFDKDIGSSLSFPNTDLSFNDVATKAYTEGLVTNASHLQPDFAHSSINFPGSAPELGNSHLELNNNSAFGLAERNPSNVVENFVGLGSQQASEPYSTGFNSTVGGLFNGSSYSAANESFVRRSRPSFLDSLNIKDSSVSGQPFVDNEKIAKIELPNSNAVSSAIHSPVTGLLVIDPLPTQASSNPGDDFFGKRLKGDKSFEQSLENKLEYASQKQNEDFSALEQHIEDLTQEKFSLQRALEASKGLTESLAADNSSLTESYNHQASIVNQLKAEMERLQQEIKARLVELEAIKAEYMNAHLECNAADERAKILASEVINLEEKALRLRSSELKLERELENSTAEIASYKKKISTSEKDRRDLLQTIEALQEENKLLQSKLCRASSSGISIDSNKGQKKDASTSTNDIGHESHDASKDSSEQVSSSSQMLHNVDNLLLLQNILTGEEEFSLSIPPDQVQMIQNINSLVAEITSEKEELIQALITEVSASTKLKDLNKDLSQKLEVQTQRLELLTAQSMSSEVITTKKVIGSETVRESVAYADEGDEVVERVLGWVMKLFPGGPSKRRTSRL